MLSRLRHEHILLLLILFIGLFLRLYRLDDLSLTNDDLSALSRLQYNNFQDLIEYGVTPDGHPAGVQVFLYYWTQVFGEGEMALHVPFLLGGMVAIVLGYLLGKRWFSITCGLSLAVALAAWQYPLAHSLSIRPYMPGLVGVLGMAICWTSLLQTPQRRAWLNRIGYVGFGVLGCYSHYFSLLEVGLIGIMGLFFLSKENRKSYLLSTATIAVLYLPHLPIFLQQLDKGGIGGWLGPPGNDFLFQYLNYVLHFSSWMWAVVLGLAGLTIYYALRHQEGELAERKGVSIPFRWVALGLFVLPLGIGGAYSLWVNPVLHYQVLFFAFPFLLLLLFSIPCSLSSQWQWTVTGLFLFISIGTLVFQRKHYQVFYDRGPKAIIRQQSQQPGTFLFQVNQPFYADYYRKRIAPDLIINRYEVPADYREFRNWVASLNTPTLTLAWANRMIPWEYVQIAQEYYPYMVEKQQAVVSERYVFSKNKTPHTDSPYFVSIEGFDAQTEHTHWSAGESVSKDRIFISSPYSLQLDQDHPFSATFSAPLTALAPNPYTLLETGVSVYAKGGEVTDASLAITFEREGEIVSAQYMPLSRWGVTPQTWTKVYHSLRLRHVSLVYDDKTVVKVYVWNPGGHEILLDDFGVRTVPGNPYLYGWIEPVP